MRINHKKPVIILMAVICLALVINIAAEETYSRTKSIDAGVYVTLTGNTQQRGAYMTTSTTVTQNPDEAYLRIKVQLLEPDHGDTVGNYTKTSDDGVTRFVTNVDATAIVSSTPSKIYCTHAVQGGSESDGYYVIVNFPVDTTYYD